MTAPVVAAQSVREVVDLLAEGTEPDPGEDPGLTSLSHGLQCAARLKETRPDDVELQVAGLLHDLGHRFAPGHPELHGVLGANFLRGLFGERVADLVELHVDAKRYLVAVEPEYRNQLSATSVTTLVAQGEALDQEGIDAFLARPHAADSVELRRADEAAKDLGRVVPGLETWVPVLEALASENDPGTAQDD